LVRKANERVRDDRRFTISDLSLHFPQISRSLLHDIVSSHLGRRRPHSMGRVNKNLYPATISASIMAANMWKNSLKNVESDNNKIIYETLVHFLQRNGTYSLNKPRTIKSNKPNLTILATDQLNAQILVFFNKFIIFLYMFRALLCSSSGGQTVL